MVWGLLIAYAVMAQFLPEASAALHDVFAITFGVYILSWGVGLLAIGLKINISYGRRLGFGYVNSPHIKKVKDKMIERGAGGISDHPTLIGYRTCVVDLASTDGNMFDAYSKRWVFIGLLGDSGQVCHFSDDLPGRGVGAVLHCGYYGWGI